MKDHPFRFHRALIGALALIAALIACNLPQQPAEGSTASPVATPAATSTLTQLPTRTPTPIPTPLPPDLVWFAPNMGSYDYADLFSKPEAWSEARSRINVFKFYVQNVIDGPCDICGDNTIQAMLDVDAFRVLSSEGVAIAIEVPAVKEWGCDGVETTRVTEMGIRNVQRNGGTVALLAMDEPLFGGQSVFGTTCGLTMEQGAEVTASYIQHMADTYPEIVIGDIEPYPEYSIAQLEQWLTLLEGHQAAPAFFHLDVDIERVRVEGQNVAAALQQISQFCADHNIIFGVIFTSSWKEASLSQTYYESTMGWVKTVHDAIGRPQHVIFQSWQGNGSDVHEVPYNLPDNGPDIFSHTRLILDGLAVLGP